MKRMYFVEWGKDNTFYGVQAFSKMKDAFIFASNLAHSKIRITKRYEETMTPDRVIFESK